MSGTEPMMDTQARDDRKKQTGEFDAAQGFQKQRFVNNLLEGRIARSEPRFERENCSSP
jgi:hypothetical protein